MTARTHKIVVIPGDGEPMTGPWHSRNDLADPSGIGLEVTASAIEVLRAAQNKVGGFSLEFEDLDYGSERLLRPTPTRS